MFHKVFVDIPRIASLKEYSPLVTGDVPTSLALKMAHMENEIRVLKRAHKALRQYVISVLLPQHPAADSLTHPPTESLPNIGANTFPHPMADALTQSGSGPLNGPTTPSAVQAPAEVITDHTTNSLLLPPTDHLAMAPQEPPSVEDTEVTETVPHVDIQCRQGDKTTGVAVEQFEKPAEAMPDSVNMTGTQALKEGGHGEAGQAGASVEATPADMDMDAGEDDPGVSKLQASGGGQLGGLENGEIPQDQRGHFTCTPPEVTDPAH